MVDYPPLQIVIIEPHNSLSIPYCHIPQDHTITRLQTIQQAVLHLAHNSVSVIFLSSSFPITKQLTMLEAIKNSSTSFLIPIIYVVNFNNKISTIPGSNWGGKTGVLSSLSTSQELNSILRRVVAV